MEAKLAGKNGVYRVIGVMSGSSLDGLDLARCVFERTNGRWTYSIEASEHRPFDAAWRRLLVAAMEGSALELARLDRDLGRFIGEACRALAPADLVGSHGHTIFHRPDEQLTTQIGSGAWIAATSGLPVVCDLRTVDVALGGQGAPLVPLGERALFPEHHAFLNIGGICNIALHDAVGTTGFDVCIGNQALNALAQEAGMDYDANGAMARSGEIIPTLLAELNALPFHQQAPPRSLGREWYVANVFPLISDVSHPVADRLRTVVEHIAQMVGNSMEAATGAVLVTGGGAHNGFLIERIRAHTRHVLVIPDRRTVEYKEALVFAFLGLLRWLEEPTALASVTGAQRDSVGGALYLPN